MSNDVGDKFAAGVYKTSVINNDKQYQLVYTLTLNIRYKKHSCCPILSKHNMKIHSGLRSRKPPPPPHQTATFYNSPWVFMIMNISWWWRWANNKEDKYTQSISQYVVVARRVTHSFFSSDSFRQQVCSSSSATYAPNRL
jgi:hypothetical protein